MMLHIPGVLSREAVADIRAVLRDARWTDGRHTTGAQAAGQKRNYQLPVLAPEAQGLADTVRAALLAHPLFQSAALPHTVLTPRFNAYEGGGFFGNHVDGAIQADPVTGMNVRTDVSTTVFLSDPDDYDGGELVVEDTYGAHEVKLPAGDAILYPATSVHRVEPVTRGMRLAAFTWTQPGLRRYAAPDAVRSGHDDLEAAGEGRGQRRSRGADQPLPQPDSAVGPGLTG